MEASSDPSAPAYDSGDGGSLCSVLPAFVYSPIVFYPLKTKLFGGEDKGWFVDLNSSVVFESSG